MSDNTEDPRLGALRQRGQAKLDKLFEPIINAASRSCQRTGMSPEQLVQIAMTRDNGLEIIESVGVDELAAEATAGNKESARTYDEWHKRSFPNHMKYR